jgi:DNA-binding transcriptional ArsR family regulator
MSPRKLSDADKKDILSLYQRLEETTSTLATRYDVSNSTISRILKSSLLESDYEALIQQKRSNRTSSSTTPIVEPRPSVESAFAPESEPQQPEPLTEADLDLAVSAAAEQQRWRRRRSSVTPEPVPKPRVIQTELRLDITTPETESESEELAEAFTEINSPKTSRHLEELLDDDLIDLDEEDGDQGDDDDDDDWDDYESAEVGTQGPIKTRIASGASIQVLPLSEASLPRTCYLVVDRAAELIARPLKEFGDLGRIPIEEIQEKTLPIFDNHRVARRFSNRSQRVIKVPDSRMLQKTCSHLQAKGITRLLIDGQVYSLMPEQPPI